MNLETACINIRLFKKAYELYKRNQRIDENNSLYDDNNLENEFSNNYILKKFN